MNLTNEKIEIIMEYNKLTPEEKKVIANEQLMFTSNMSPPDSELNTIGM